VTTAVAAKRALLSIGSLRSVLVPALLLVAIEVVVRLAHIPSYLLPAPSDVLADLARRPDYFITETATTVGEALLGLAIGMAAGLALGTLMTYSRVAELAIYPLAVGLRSTPSIAIAPIFIIWFGFGIMPKAIVAAISTFFPFLVNSLVGLRAVDATALEFFRTVRASRREIFSNLRVPNMLPYFFAALRLSVSLSLIGAIVGELASARHGVGYIIVQASERLQTAEVFAGVTVLALVGITLTQLVDVVGRRALAWHESQRLRR